MNDSTPLPSELAELRDRIGIAELYVRYALALDEQDLDLLASCFVEDVDFVCSLPGVPSRRGIKANQDRLVQRHKERKFRERHMTAPPVIRRLSGDRAEASAEVAILMKSDGGPVHVEAIGRYDDVLAKHGGRWKFARRKFVADT